MTRQQPESSMAYQAITYRADELLTVYVDREHATARVTYNYDDRGEQSTPFQTADLPADDQAAAEMVNDWIDG